MQIDRIRLQIYAPDQVKGLIDIEQIISHSGLAPGLIHLVRLHASQINRCAHCIGKHCEDAREAGESQVRLDRLSIWREVDDFSEAERAALAWTEALTELNSEVELDTLFEDLVRSFSAEDIAALTTQIAMINVWNRLQIASHGRRGSYIDSLR